MLNLAEPADKTICETSRDTVREQEVQVFLENCSGTARRDFHAVVKFSN
jgi:hypothetical protein